MIKKHKKKLTMFLLQFPGCKNRMKYQPMRGLIADSRKTCVYCGKSFGVKKAIVKKV